MDYFEKALKSLSAYSWGGIFEVGAAVAAVIIAVASLRLTYIQFGNARRREVLDLLSQAYAGEIASARATVGAAFETGPERGVRWEIVPKNDVTPRGSVDESSVRAGGKDPAVAKKDGLLVSALGLRLGSEGVNQSSGKPEDDVATLNSLYLVLWYFNQVDALRQSLPRISFLGGGARRLLDKSIQPVMVTYLRYYGPRDPAKDKLVGNIERPSITTGNGHEGLISLAESIRAFKKLRWQRAEPDEKLTSDGPSSDRSSTDG